MALLFRDITTQKIAEENLHRITAELTTINQRQAEFLAVMAHELRNPLEPLRTGLDLLRIGSDNPETVSRVRSMMERQVDHLVHLVDDLLDLARVNSGKITLKKERVELKDAVLRAVDTSLPMIQAKHHQLVVDVADEPIWLDADVNRLSQVISNLLTNAAKYTPEEGRIELSVRREESQAVIEIIDNGIGIEAAALPHIFDMFAQSQHGLAYAQGGLGIGLNLVKRLTEKHGGTVCGASDGIGRGSRFSVRLPINQRTTDDSMDAPSSHGVHSSHRPLRILVVDDNRDAAQMVAELLRVIGNVVEVCYDAPSALVAAERILPDLALLDIGMPEMSGHDLAQAIRKAPRLQHVALVALTGWGTEEDRVKSQQAGFDYHLTKPVSVEGLKGLVSQVLASSSV